MPKTKTITVTLYTPGELAKSTPKDLPEGIWLAERGAGNLPVMRAGRVEPKDIAAATKRPIVLVDVDDLWPDPGVALDRVQDAVGDLVTALFDVELPDEARAKLQALQAAAAQA